jgi:RHS repeat-associated protein
MTTKYQPNDANQYAKIAHGTEVVEPEYDPQGNLLHDATRKYTWDADIHLTAVSTQTGQPGTKNPEQRTEFKYDPLHRRIARIKDSGEVTLYTYEGWNVVAEKTTPTAPQLDTENLKLETRYVWGEDLSGTLQGAGGIGGLLRSTIVEAKPNGTRQTEHEHTFSYDSNGNIILLTGPKAQETARYSYDAFGKTLTATGPAAQTNRYQFSTKPVEEESGLVYYGYRWYDPVTGRWPSRDPIEERGGVNLYGMVGNGATIKLDRLGLQSGSERCAECAAQTPLSQAWRPRTCCGGTLYDLYPTIPVNISPPNPSLYGTYFPMTTGYCCGDANTGSWIAPSDAACCRDGEKLPLITFAEAMGINVDTCVAWFQSMTVDNGTLWNIASSLGPTVSSIIAGLASGVLGAVADSNCSKMVCAKRGEARAVFDGLQFP